ncbi:Amine oxidase (copper-containing) [Xylanimonas cellulosilytica DSM 15894]|uniref:Amine oxidase n=1 Tax=Xylanimonas cellulosilytica (strain DSM 15894 / JCM 12276 / CECT 5975 / KCTC 9989 / LMG 20990 / NBRC 107835 / XIL07) TaxID=446471 RepID=D1BZU0_XYLCX|nr:primary-amine oxidase [Xylanimonas cellulosilytica]ACZ32068.1 Amine oxidase (copper-containing) [Xylanimonas cellulosilytica DSM 15894]
MTVTLTTTTITHPLATLRADEIAAAAAIVADAGLVQDTTKFVYVGLLEAPKSAVLAWEAGTGSLPARQVRVQLLELATGVQHDVVADVTAGAVVSVEQLDTAEVGQLPILDTEFELIPEIVAASTEWAAALAARGLTPEQVVTVPLSAGVFGHEDEVGKRMARVFAFRMDHPADHPWAHPVDGLVAYVNLTTREVTRVIDHAVMPVPAEHGNYTDPSLAGTPRTTLKPIEITQPQGASFQVSDDGEVTWEGWRLRVSFDAREGLVLHRMSVADGDEQRPVVYRASISEMVVPYADPSPTRYWQNYFDTGEYLFGRYVNSLELGCDCLGEIHYLDVTLADESGAPRVVKNGICMHEEDYGVLWKHSDIFTGINETRRQRRLVISFFTTVGNYDYGFYWYLYLDGTIECEAKLTGFLFSSAYPGAGADGEPYAFASEVAPGLGAPYHQHLFSARLDLDVDGTPNAVDEVDAVRLPISETNPWGNAFTARRTRLVSEAQAARVADGAVGRTWHISSTERTNRLGRPTAYALYAQETPTLMAAPDSSIAARAAFATKHVWVTQFADDERYAAGTHVNQHAGGAGLPAFQAADRSLEGTDVVVWHTFGLTHFPRPEDWPVMPVDYAKFTLKPYGFFDRNPTLGLAASTSSHCAPAASSGAAGQCCGGTHGDGPCPHHHG